MSSEVSVVRPGLVLRVENYGIVAFASSIAVIGFEFVGWFVEIKFVEQIMIKICSLSDWGIGVLFEIGKTKAH